MTTDPLQRLKDAAEAFVHAEAKLKEGRMIAIQASLVETDLHNKRNQALCEFNKASRALMTPEAQEELKQHSGC